MDVFTLFSSRSCFFKFSDVYLGDIIKLCMDRRGVQQESKNFDSERIILTFKLPVTFFTLIRLSSILIYINSILAG